MANEVVSVEVPMTFKKRGGRKVIVLPDGTQGNPARKATIDNTMVKAIARAFRWQKLLENGTYGCIEDIARGEKIGTDAVHLGFRWYDPSGPFNMQPDMHVVKLTVKGQGEKAVYQKELKYPDKI